MIGHAQRVVNNNKSEYEKFWVVLLSVAVVALALFVYFRFYFVFGEGVKSGEQNYVVYKGVLFKPMRVS